MCCWRPDGRLVRTILTLPGRVLLVPALLIVLVAGLLLAGHAAAQETPVNVAGVVVEYGDGQVSYGLVPFTEESLSGFDLLDRTGLSLLAIEFGGLGQGICAIEDTGCDIDACRARMCQTGDPNSPFWHYSQYSAGEGWAMVPLGASSSRVTDGTIDAWAWSSDEANPAITSIEDIADELGVDLDAVRAGDSLEPVVSIPEGMSNEPAAVGEREIAAVAVLGVVAVAGVVIILRSRRPIAS